MSATQPARGETSSMWDTLSEPWRICLQEAWAAYRAGSIPIGAAITDPTGRILTTGRNRIFEDSGEPCLLSGHRLAHAEMNALLSLEGLRDGRHACALYTTTEPCPLCTGAIRQYGVREVHYASRDPAAGSIELLRASAYMRRRPIAVTGPHPVLEAIIMAMHVEFSMVARGQPPDWWVFEWWQRVVPEGVRLGAELAASGEIRRLHAANAPTSEVLNRLAELAAAPRALTSSS